MPETEDGYDLEAGAAQQHQSPSSHSFDLLAAATAAAKRSVFGCRSRASLVLLFLFFSCSLGAFASLRFTVSHWTPLYLALERPLLPSQRLLRHLCSRRLLRISAVPALSRLLSPSLFSRSRGSHSLAQICALRCAVHPRLSFSPVPVSTP